MSHSLLLEGSRSQLVHQLCFFDEEKEHVLKQYYPEPSPERKHLEQIISDYCATLERILSELIPEHLNSTILIGSQVKLQYVEDKFTESYIIVFPHESDPNENKISWLSPIGLQLLMKKKDAAYQLHVPSGKIAVKIKEIKYMNYGSIEKQM
ncbi:transcription elongation factor GreA [Paenibacillus sp. DS2015]|uniref:GreA/GreB family elongation factor n=1 Tax=Paenibacillus sp. DS2015 TaxID=3373917 RepID=UPI003D23B2F1